MKTKRVILYICIVLFALPFVGISQSRFEIAGYGKGMFDARSNVSYSGGVSLEWQPRSKSLGLNYSLRFGENEYGSFMFQCPVGALTGLLAFAFDDNGLGSLLGLVLCCIPEGLSYNITNDHEIAVAPYLNPLLLSFSKDEIRPVCEIGTKLKFPIGNVLFGAFDFCVQSPYDAKRVNTVFGISFGGRI